ncbi:MAG TPA: hypothetical protein PKK33_03700, partial [Candidatus Cloacimonadota bacterium]|nr:hypothetical protein [Candidatus Cloacimonadota bacterium]
MKKFLLLTYYFAPCGGAGVQRWLRLLKYLPQYGWLPTVITTEDGDYPVRDESLLTQIPEQVKVIRTKTPSFGSLFKSILGKNEKIPYGSLQTSTRDSLTKRLMYWVRLNLVLPDARVVWNRSCHKAALKELMSDKYECIVTTGPPQSTHLVGLKLQKANRMKWITDFRDPWTKIYYLELAEQNQAVQVLNRRMEKKVVGNADLNLVISQYISDSLPDGRKKVLMNGFDPEDFKAIKFRKKKLFRIKYVGKLTEGQDIHKFLKIIAQWTSVLQNMQVELSFIGTFDEVPVDIQAYGLKIQNIPFVHHGDALHEMVNAEMLLLIINEYEGNEGMLTTKLFEYIGSRSPILCIGPKLGEAAKLVTRFKAGAVCDYEDSKAIEYALQYYYKQWQEGDDLRNEEDVSEITAPVQAG